MSKTNVEAFVGQIKSRQIDLRRRQITTLQVNMGKLCNQACSHCHVDASPYRTEIMEAKTVARLLELLDESASVETVDLTGGAPELNPHFRTFVLGITALGKNVIDRCNLTVLFEKGQEDTAEFLAKHRVQIVASLPCYSQKNVDEQRGRGVFNKSLKALKILNALGYGKVGSGLILDLVYNPTGPFLPPPQKTLQADYKEKLRKDFEIEFNNLFTITNMPIKRYSQYLKRLGGYDSYMNLLVENFNPKAAEEVMCRDLVSIGYDGLIYDCDFNQMLEMSVPGKQDIWKIKSLSELESQNIIFDNHCYGCTAGAGSSCGGSLTN